MNIFQKIRIFLKKIFQKTDNIKMINTQSKELNKKNTVKLYFVNSLKLDVKETKKVRVETLVVPGCGLGINNKVEY